MRPGTRLRAWASRFCSPQTMDRLIDPVIADMRHEDAVGGTGRWERHWVLLCGYAAFWRVVAHLPLRCTKRSVRALVTSERLAAGRGVCAAAATMLILTALLVALQWQPITIGSNQVAWTTLLLVPQTLPLTLPIVVLVGVLCGLRGRAPTTSIQGTVLVVGLVGSLLSLGTVRWLMPAADQAFRVAIARDAVFDQGTNELAPASLREQALGDRNEGRLNRAGILLFAYHVRWAIIAAAVVFALFGLGIKTLRIHPLVAAGISAVACSVYIIYFFELGAIRPSVFSDERVAIALAWLPNLTMTLASLLFLSSTGAEAARDRV
jgi:hypothetical protein